MEELILKMKVLLDAKCATHFDVKLWGYVQKESVQVLVLHWDDEAPTNDCNLHLWGRIPLQTVI